MKENFDVFLQLLLKTNLLSLLVGLSRFHNQSLNMGFVRNQILLHPIAYSVYTWVYQDSYHVQFMKHKRNWNMSHGIRLIFFFEYISK